MKLIRLCYQLLILLCITALCVEVGNAAPRSSTRRSIKITSRNRPAFILISRSRGRQLFCHVNGRRLEAGYLTDARRKVFTNFSILISKAAHNRHLSKRNRRRKVLSLRSQNSSALKKCQSILNSKSTPTPTATPSATPTLTTTPTPNATATPTPTEPTPTPTEVPIQFNKKVVLQNGAANTLNFRRPTTLTFGPDGRLYVGQQNGIIHVLTLDASHNVTAVQVVTAIYNTPTTNEDGTRATDADGRQVTGIFVDPASSAQAPVLYVVHSDPRIGNNNDDITKEIDTDGGVLTRLVGPDFNAPQNRTDLVTGLPRSRENHAPNGMQLGADGWLYIGAGGDTNFGAPSTFFSNRPEVNLSGAILRVNLAALTRTIDVSAGSHAGSFIGAGEIPGLFEVYASGYRNPYDLLWHSNGKLYSNVNEGNSGFGDTPGPADGCPNTQALNPGTINPDNLLDKLFLITPGAYGGHPNPSRGKCVFDNGSTYSPPLAPEANYTPPLYLYRGSLSVNGIAEYTSSAFFGQLRGDILSVSTYFGPSIRDLKLNAAGTAIVKDTTIASDLNGPIDLIVHPDGTIFVAEIFNNDILALEPAQYGTAGDNDGDAIADAQDPDDDNDGYSDDDELANGTNSFNPASVPPDADRDHLSDLLDNDDDNDGIADNSDPFRVDASNGTNTALPVRFEWNPEDAALGALKNSGFSGVMLSPASAGYLPGNISVGAAGGFLSIVPSLGTMIGSSNNQDNALQIGVNASPNGGLGTFTVQARLTDPFFSPKVAPLGAEGAGIFIGLGQDDFIRLAVTGDTGGGADGIQWTSEVAGVTTANLVTPVPLNLGTQQLKVDLYLEINPSLNTITAKYRLNSSSAGDIVNLGTISPSTVTGLSKFFTQGLGAGIVATRAGQTNSQFVAVYDYFRVQSGASS